MNPETYARLIDYLKASTKHGISPSYEEIREKLGLSSKSAVYRMIKELEARKIITQSNKIRSIKVVER